jgi:N-acetylmuramoyl-L-alanine amidase
VDRGQTTIFLLRLGLFSGLSLVLSACAPLPQRAGVPVVQWPSPNFNERRPSYVILHHTGSDNVERALRTLSDRLRRVSAHYVIARDGRIYYMVDELARAWHAGESYWTGNRDLNSASIGIELDNNGEEPFAATQIESLLALLADLRERYDIPAGNFLGHGDVSPGRKTDPSHYFPWRTLAAHGFGLWCDPPYPSVPESIDNATLLNAFGYDVSRPEAAITAFKRRFTPHDVSPEMTEQDRALLYCLLLQKQDS